MAVSAGLALTRPARCRHGPRPCPSRLPGFGSIATVTSCTAASRQGDTLVRIPGLAPGAVVRRTPSDGRDRVGTGLSARSYRVTLRPMIANPERGRATDLVDRRGEC